MDRKLISIMTPCYNEEGNLPNLYARVTKVIDGMTDYDFEWVIIDNDSQDSSRQILRELAEKDSRLKVIFNLRNFGPDRSSASGLYQTSGDASICVAADLQDPPELIPSFIEKWESGCDVVMGRIISSEESAGAFATRGLLYKILDCFSETHVESHVTGFGLYSQAVVNLMREEGRPKPSFRLSVSNFGYKISYIDFRQPVRVAGKSSYSFMTKLNTAIDMLIEVSDRPIRIITLTGAGLSAFSVAVTLLLIILNLLSPAAFYLYLILIFLILLVAGLLALSMGVVGEYVAMVQMYVKRVPLVIEKCRINF